MQFCSSNLVFECCSFSSNFLLNEFSRSQECLDWHTPRWLPSSVHNYGTLDLACDKKDWAEKCRCGRRLGNGRRNATVWSRWVLQKCIFLYDLQFDCKSCPGRWRCFSLCNGAKHYCNWVPKELRVLHGLAMLGTSSGSRLGPNHGECGIPIFELSIDVFLLRGLHSVFRCYLNANDTCSRELQQKWKYDARNFSWDRF